MRFGPKAELRARMIAHRQRRGGSSRRADRD